MESPRESESISSAFVVITTSIIGFFILLLFCLVNRRKGQAVEDEKEAHQNGDLSSKPKDNHVVTVKATGRKSQKSSAKVETVSHKWLESTLKGHAGEVTSLDFSSNGKYLASCSDDRGIVLWSVKEFGSKDKRPMKTSIDFDHATLVRFSPDSKALIASLAVGNKIGVFKMIRKEDSHNLKLQGAENIDFPSVHKYDIMAIGISCNGKFIMSASADNCLIVWSLQGEVLKQIDTKQGNLHFATVSPCGRFIASSGFTPDVKVYEVVFNKSGDFVDVVRAFELKGHSSGVFSFAFNADSSRMVTASKDGNWKLWKTDIEYSKGQEPYLLETFKLTGLKDATSCRVAMSPDGEAFAISIGNNLRIFETDGGLLAADAAIDGVHASNVMDMAFSADGDYLATCGDRQVNVFQAVPRFRVRLRHLEQQLQALESGKSGVAGQEAMKERLKTQIGDLKGRLAKILFS